MQNFEKIDIFSFLDLQDDFVKKWHKNNIGKDYIKKNFKNKFASLILHQHYFNIILWHLEDQARRKDVGDKEIARIKRLIDKNNQKRSDYIEKIDNFLVKKLEKVSLNQENLLMSSETPGSIIDRLFILSLKIFHMREETKRDNVKGNYINRCKMKLEVLIEQREDLKNCLAQLMEDLFKGKKRLKVYYQFKMYNDPQSNPALYKKEGRNFCC